ncbi:hypothetical protein Dsin_020320 [Dipteronia sinensis]|uniref:DCD domain-containing protein n=1 Tax=Dipteronia sinensis TaxID=43782 RepID=A0AAE0A9M7_9ROSI|nr:hypothetical protein Dsin_020320 [Dipteronia sinensis]
MDEMNGEFTPISELEDMFEKIDTEIIPSSSMQMNGKESNVVLGDEVMIEHQKESTIASEDKEKSEHEIGEASNEENTKEEMKNEEDTKSKAKDEETDVVLGDEDKIVVEHLEESIIASEDEEKTEHEIGEVSNEENAKEEMKNEEDTKSEAKDEDTIEVDSRKKVSKLRKKPKRLKTKKKVVLRRKTKGALNSMSKLDKDSVTGNVDTEMVPPDLVKMDVKESSNSASMSDKNDITDVGIEIATADKIDTTAKMNGEESDVVDKDEHLKESIMVSGDEEKKECGISETSNQESAKEEVKNEEKTRNEEKNEEQLEANLKKKVSRLRKRGKKKTAALMGTNEVASKYTDNPESSNKKSKMMAKGTGMIFMCSSKTKKDCYHYKVLGLPASKRDMVLKICVGMKLFLFDIDSKLMYGIYKAAGPGGYNIEPKAFKSAYPSQVRFTVQEDCAPLAEKEFKKIIKDNYYNRNQFHCELTSKQVKDLCNLFRVSIKSSKSKRLLRTQRAEVLTHVDHESKQLRRSRKAETHTNMDPKPKRLRRSPRAETRTILHRDSARHHHWEEERHPAHPAPPRDYLYPEKPVIYRWEAYASPEAYPPPRRPLPLPSAAALPPSLDADIYRRDRLDADIYRRDQRLYRDPQFLDGELRPRNEFAPRDPYLTSREHSLYGNPLFSSSRPPEYHPRQPSDEYHPSPGLRPEYRHHSPPGLRPEYEHHSSPGLRPEYQHHSSTGLRPEYRHHSSPGLRPEYRHHSSPGLRPEYRPPRPLYRY